MKPGLELISFNYDTLVERAAGRINTRGNEHLLSGQLYPVQLTLSTRRDAIGSGVQVRCRPSPCTSYMAPPIGTTPGPLNLLGR